MTPEQFLTFADPLPEPMFLLTGSGLILAGNRAIETQLRIALHDIRGKNLGDFMGDRPDEIAHYLGACSRSRSLTFSSLELIREGGESTALRTEGTLLRPRTEESEAILMLRLVPKELAIEQFVALNQRIGDLSREIHRRKAAEATAMQEAERLRVMLHSIGDAVIGTDVDGRVEFLNPVAEELTGWKTGEAAGQKLEDVFHIVNEETRQPVENPALRALKDGKIVGLANHTILISKDRTERPIDDSAAPVRDGEKRIVGAVLVFRDVSERRQSEIALRAGEQLLRDIMDNVPALISYVDVDCRYLLNNQVYERWFGQPRSQFTGRHMRDLLGDEAWSTVGPKIKEALAGKTVHYESQVTYQDAGSRWIEATYVPRIGAAGEVTGVVVLVNDITERKQAEETLRESEEQLRLLADTIPQMAWMARPNGSIFWCNRRWYEYTGDTPSQIKAWQKVHPDVLPQVLERWRASLATGEPFDMVLPIKGANGQFRHFLTRINPLISKSGQILKWFGTSTDVTELREARKELAVSEERLRLALDAGRMGVWDWNIRTGDLKWSDSLEPLHGLAPGTFRGTFDHFQELIHLEDREMVNAAIEQALETSGEFYVEFRNVWQNGVSRWIAGSGKAFPGADGQPSRMIGIGLDVTQGKRAEQTSRFLADASAALAVLVDFDSTLQKVSSLAVPAFADWATVDLVENDGSLRRVSVSHIDPAKVQLAHDVHRRFPPDPAAPQGAWKILRTGRSEIVPEITEELLQQSVKNDELLGILRKLGLKSYIGVPLTVRGKTLGVITFINAESGHVYGDSDLAVAEDLASRAAIAIENAQLYRALRDADQRKDEFLATLAHELRNPLAPIRNGLEVLRLDGMGSDLFGEIRSMMERQLSQMVRLVDDLLDVSRITRNKLELRKEQVLLSTVLNSAVETSRPLMEQSGHNFSLEVPSEPIHLDADLTRLAQVFSNLLNNAAKYTEPGGQISLTGLINDGEVEVRVRDNGLGIPAEALPRIFEMFSQVDGNMERAQGGLGIGLTLVRRLVAMHGGSVEATSDGPGKGSEFVIRLPVVESICQPATRNDDHATEPTAKWRILVVDDNKDAAISVGMMLKLLGHQTLTVHDGLAAVESAEKFRPDIILLDIGLPKLNGYDACRLIREQPWSKGMEVVAVTGWGQEEDRRRSREAGFDHHLVKPIELDSLRGLLACHVARPPSIGNMDGNTMRDKTSLRILVVDDRRDAIFMLQTLLSAAGHDVRTASDGLTALTVAMDYQPDVAVLDIGLPGMSGLEVAKRIRQQSTLKNVVLIALTGHGDESDRQRSFDAGFDHHLIKPADIRSIKKILATVARKST
jgi:PAS domain S-box-containing protein